MKKILFLTLLTSSLACTRIFASTRVVSNIAQQPIWGPVGYDHADFYFLPEIDCYYDIAAHQFVYEKNGSWVYSTSVPPQAKSIDLFRTYKVVMRGQHPWFQHVPNRIRYVSYRTNHTQPVIRDCHQQRYWVIADHPEHNKLHAEDHK